MQPLPGTVRLTRSLQGIELYFPPLRDASAALMLALFGISCFIPGFFAAVAVAPLAESGPAGMLSMVLMSIFILPFIAFGLLFVMLAVYQVANSLTVRVTEAEIRSQRRVFGMGLSERRVTRADIAGLDAVAVIRHRKPREDVSYYSLVVKSRSTRPVTVAESLRGEALMGQVKAEIVKAGRLEHLMTAGNGPLPANHRSLPVPPAPPGHTSKDDR
jgi:hypothetical protein